MRDTTMPPALVQMLIGDPDVLVGAGKMVFCEHEGKTLFGGVVKPNIGNPEYGGWKMATGTLIWVPCEVYIENKDIFGGWELSDIITQGGLDPKYWNVEK